MRFLEIFNRREGKGMNRIIRGGLHKNKLYMGVSALLLGCMLMTSPLVAMAETDPDFPDETNSIDDVDIQNKKQTIVEGTQITPIKIVPTNTGEWTKVDEMELGLMGLRYDMSTYLITGKYNLREPWGKDEEVKKVFEAIKVIRHDSRVENRRLVFIVQRDTDRDGIPDITDTDDDNDGYTDVEEKAKGSDPKNAKSIPATPIIPAQVQPVRPSTGRINDKDRVGTAINISKKYYNKANTVIVVRHDLFPDSMTASVLAKLKDAPILLNPTDKLDGF